MRRVHTRVSKFVRLTASALLLVQFACSNDPGAEGEGEGTSTQDTNGTVSDDIAQADGGTTTVTPDAQAEDAPSTTEDGAATDDAVSNDAESDSGAVVLDCPGSVGCECAKNDECDSGICIDSADGKICAQTCVDNCPDNQTCTKFDPGSGDAVFICTPHHVTLCSPCAVDADCQLYEATSLCLDYGDGGKFCGSGCETDADCPDSYGCASVEIGGGNQKKQCKLKDKGAVCDCSKLAIAGGKGTTCNIGNDLGSCSGKRSCGETGLSACDAPSPASETCDSVDNDCNGSIDDIDAASFGCLVKAWFDVGSKTSCATDSDCSADGESCADDTKTCRKLIGACPGKASCEKGALKCETTVAPKQELCNGDDDDCDGAVDEDYPWVHPLDQTEVKIGGTCGTGACAGGTVKCETLSKSVCDTETTNKADKDACNGKDDDCNGLIDDGACDDGNACTTDTCDAVNAACETTAASDCDDSNPCTADVCDAKSGKCISTFQDASCEDGNACTVGDKCAQDGDKAVCQGGAAQVCDDGNLCTDDGCDPATGCVGLPNAATQVCYSAADPESEGTGTCKSGVKTCKDGVQLVACDGEVLPAVKEACDGLDDTCDGKTDEGCSGTDVTRRQANRTASRIKKGWRSSGRTAGTRRSHPAQVGRLRAAGVSRAFLRRQRTLRRLVPRFRAQRRWTSRSPLARERPTSRCCRGTTPATLT